MSTSYFTPRVAVDDDGTISIDWSDSYDDTHGHENATPDDEDAAQVRHTALLDSLVAHRPSVEGLRALGDHIAGTCGLTVELPDGCTATSMRYLSALQVFGLQHDGNTCPVHEHADVN